MTRPAWPASRRGRAWAWVLAAGVLAAAAVRAPGVAGDLRAAAGHLGGLRPAWLGAAVAAQGVALAGGTAAQRQLLAAAGAWLRWRTVFGLVLASTGLARVMPAGPVTGGAWQVREYRRRGAGTGPGVWAVLAGGATATVVLLALLLAGAAAAGIGPIPLLACAAGLLAADAAGLFAAARRARALARWLSRRPRRSRTIAGLAAAAAGLSRRRAGPGWAAGVLACTGTGLLADAGVLAACFGLTGLPDPLAGPAVRLRRRAAGRAARPAAWRDRRRRRRHARRAHPHLHRARRGGRRGHRLPGGRVLDRRCRRDRGGSRPRPPLPGRPRAGAGAHPGSQAGRRDGSRPARRPARRHRSAPCRHRRFPLTIIAATGGVGRELLEQAAATGHDVTAPR